MRLELHFFGSLKKDPKLKQKKKKGEKAILKKKHVLVFFLKKGGVIHKFLISFNN